MIHEASGAEPEAAASTSAEGAIDLSQGFDENFSAGSLPIPDALEEIPSAKAESSAPVLESKAGAENISLEQPVSKPHPLPASVNPNPNPDPFDRSILISMIPEPESEAFPVSASTSAEEAQAQEAARFAMSERLFQLVASEQSFDELVLAGLQAILHAVNGFSGSILELDHEKEDFFFRASFGTKNAETLKAFRVPITKGIVGHVAETERPLLIRDLAEDKMQMRAISASVGFDAVTCMAAPIMITGQPYGVIEIFNKIDGGKFSQKDLAILEDGVKMFTKVLHVRFLLAEFSRRERRG